jgi:capsular polysaccharide transport system permease protein
VIRSEPTMIELARRQGRVIGALVLREMRASYGKVKIGYLWAILRPIMFIAVVSMLFSLRGRVPPFGTSMPLFFATGILPFYLFSRTIREMSNVLDRNEDLFEYPIVKPIDSLVARVLLDGLTYTLAVVICISAMIYVLEVPSPDRPHVCALAMLGMALLALGTGTLFAVLSKLVPSWRMLLATVQRPLVFFSGVLHPIEHLPVEFQNVLAWNPLVHGVELFRNGYYMGYRCRVLDIDYLFTCGIVMCVLGFAAERILRQRGG